MSRTKMQTATKADLKAKMTAKELKVNKPLP
jgi:hypothetical protein